MFLLIQYNENKATIHKIGWWVVWLFLLLINSQNSYSRQASPSKMLKNAIQLTKADQYDSSLAIVKMVREQIPDSIANPIYANTFRIEAENYINLSEYSKADSLLNIGTNLLKLLPGDHSLILADFYHSISRNLGAQNRHDSSLTFERKAFDIWRSTYGENHPAIAKSLTQIGFNLRLKGLYDSALQVYNQAIRIYNETSGDYSSELAGCFFDVGWVFAAKGQLGKALAYNEKSLNIRQQLYGENNLNTGNVINMLGWCYNRMGYHIKALEYFKRSLNIRIRKLGKSHPNVAVSYLSIGNLYYELRQYEKAVLYLEEGTQIWVSKFGEKDRALVRNYNSLAQVYEAVHDTTKTLEYLNKAIKVADMRLENYHPDLLQTYRLLARYQQQKNDINHQLQSLQRAKEVAIQSFGITHPNYGYVISDLAEFYKQNHDIETALRLHQKALTVLSNSLGGMHSAVAQQHVYMGDIYADSEQLDNSVKEYRRVLKKDSIDFNSNEDNEFKIAHNIVSITAMAKIGEVLTTQWQENSSNLSLLKQALKTYEKAIILIDQIRKKYTKDSDRQKLFEDASKVYENGIATAIKLYEITDRPVYLELGFQLSEKSKSFILINSLNENIARKYSDLPDSLFEKEQLLKAEISHIESRLLRAKAAKNSKQIRSFQSELFEISNKLEALQEHLESSYPKYYNLKYNDDKPIFSEIIDNLTDERTAIIEYFITDTLVYSFVLSKDGITVNTILNDQKFRINVSKLQMATGDYEFITNNAGEADLQYITSAYSLYHDFLSPSLQALSPEIENLIIVGDGILNQLNFEVFLTEEQDANKKVNYASLPFLLKDYRISYAYSTEFLLKAKTLNNSLNGSTYAGFAPITNFQVHPNDTFDIFSKQKYVTLKKLTLPGAKQEVLNISNIINGDQWIGEVATESLFKERAAQYNILHLATHGLINNDRPLLSELLFNSDSLNDGLLNVAEIYGLSLNADLTVLSACNTGIGKSKKGEGSMSISRAFSYAGCPSVIMSLWKIPDKATSSLMLHLYEAIGISHQKGASLQSAKLQYISNVEEVNKAHPFYWAGFILMGDPGEITVEPSSNSAIWIVAGIALLLIVFFLVKKLL